MTQLLTQILTQENTDPSRYEISANPPEPKFTCGQPVKFTITITGTAVIDGEGEWDGDEEKYFYGVVNTEIDEDMGLINLHRSEEFGCGNELVVNERTSMFSEDQLNFRGSAVGSADLKPLSSK